MNSAQHDVLGTPLAPTAGPDWKANHPQGGGNKDGTGDQDKADPHPAQTMYVAAHQNDREIGKADKANYSSDTKFISAAVVGGYVSLKYPSWRRRMIAVEQENHPSIREPHRVFQWTGERLDQAADSIPRRVPGRVRLSGALRDGADQVRNENFKHAAARIFNSYDEKSSLLSDFPDYNQHLAVVDKHLRAISPRIGQLEKQKHLSDDEERELENLRRSRKTILDVSNAHDPYVQAEALKAYEDAHLTGRGVIPTDVLVSLKTLQTKLESSAGTTLPERLKLLSSVTHEVGLGGTWGQIKGIYRLRGMSLRSPIPEASGLWKVVPVVGTAWAANHVLGNVYADTFHDRGEADRLFRPGWMELVGDGAIAASTKDGLTTFKRVAAWELITKNLDMNNWQALVTDALAVPATYALTHNWKTAIGLPLTALAAGRVYRSIFDQTDKVRGLNDDAALMVMRDSNKMNGRSMNNAVDAYRDLGAKWPGILPFYLNQVTPVFKPTQLKSEQSPNYERQIESARTLSALNKAYGLNILDRGLAHGEIQDMYSGRTPDGKPYTRYPGGAEIVDSGPHEDPTGAALKKLSAAYTQSYETVELMTDAQAVQDKNDKTADPKQKLPDTMRHRIQDSDINDAKENMADINGIIWKDIIRETPDGKPLEPHDIQGLVENTHNDFINDRTTVKYGNAIDNQFDVGVFDSASRLFRANFSLTEWARHEYVAGHGYSKAYQKLDTIAVDDLVQLHKYDTIAKEQKDAAAQATGADKERKQFAADYWSNKDEIQKKLVAKELRDAALMRLAEVNGMLPQDDEESTRPDFKQIANRIGNNADQANFNNINVNGTANYNSLLNAAAALDPSNPDLQAIREEAVRVMNNVNQTYRDTASAAFYENAKIAATPGHQQFQGR